jgi:hypothetical protein
MNLDHANILVAEFLADAREPDYSHLIDAADLFDDGPTAIEILDALVEAFDVPAVEIVERLACVDIAVLREVAAP